MVGIVKTLLEYQDSVSILDKIESSFEFTLHKNPNSYAQILVEKLHEIGLLTYPLPENLNGHYLGTAYKGARLAVDVLEAIGSKDLSLARLYEGHINAVKLVSKFGTKEQFSRMSESIYNGHIFAIWNTEPSIKLKLEKNGSDFKLVGSKVFASGVGHINHAIITVQHPSGGTVMVMINLEKTTLVTSTDKWKFNAMYATGTGEIDLTGIDVQKHQIIGDTGDYYKEPDFSAGAWRTLAAQTGAIKSLYSHFKNHINENSHSEHPIQRARLGDIAVAYQTAHQWVCKCAEIAERTSGLQASHLTSHLKSDDLKADEPKTAITFINLARRAVTNCAETAMSLVLKGIGARSFLVQNPVEQICRDLSFYLKQPSPDFTFDEAAQVLLTKPDSFLHNFS